MKTKWIALAIFLPLASFATTCFPIIETLTVVQDKLNEEILITEKNGIAVYASTFSHEGSTYATLEFKNTTNEQIKIIWSAVVGGNSIAVNLDGTIESYITIEPNSSVKFGKFNSNDPLIELASENTKEEMVVNIKIQ
jgi:hypothetical protein